MPRPRRRRTPTRALLGGVLAGFALGSCADAGVGIPPPDDQLFFPSGLLLDPRVEEGAAARWLFVTNANSDLVYNGASLTAIDLDAFFAAWQDPLTFRPNDKVADIEAAVDEDRPCRRNTILPQVVECTEEPFLAAERTVHTGSFTTVLRAHQREDGRWRLLTPVRGDPSVAYVNLGAGDEVDLECGREEDARDPRRCSNDSRIRYLRNDPGYRTLGREPTNILIVPQVKGIDRNGAPLARDLAFITHTEIPEVTLVDLDGIAIQNGTSPAIVDIQALFSDQNLVGGYGLAVRPCTPPRPVAECASERDLCLLDPQQGQALCDAAYSLCVDGNAPAVTNNCERPLVYAAHRKTEFMLRMSVEQVALSLGDVGGEPVPLDYTCETAAKIEEGVPGGLLCEHRLVYIDQFAAVAVDSAQSVSGGFGDIAFSRDGNSLYAVRNAVGGLVRIDTSIDERGDTTDTPAAQVEVCAEPSAMVWFGDGATEYAAISCYRPGTIYVVDLGAFRVVEQVFVGAGPHQMVVDAARSYLYVANSLDATISVVDVGRTRPSRFTEVARIGLQEPYSG